MRTIPRIAASLSLMVALGAVPALADSDLGIRVGFTDGIGDVYLGVEWETGGFVGPAEFTPSADLEVDDRNLIAINGDLRWDIIPLPETDVMLYAKAGPTLLVGDDSELGISLTFGGDIGMKQGRSLQIEVRLGFGGVNESKIGAALMFGF
jgi:hypothetical protein